METPNLNNLIQQACKLSKPELNLFIQSVILHNKKSEPPLTEKEKEFIEKSSLCLDELKSINKSLDQVIKKFE